VQGILIVLGKGGQGSETYNFAAPDTYAHRPTREMMAEFHPTSEVVSPLSGYDSIINCSEWLSVYGYQPQYLLERQSRGN
jgi:hypothetical protein